MKTVKLNNGVEIELLTNGQSYEGIGKVSVNGVALRSARRPMNIAIRNPSGVELFDFQIAGEKISGTGVTLELVPSRRDGGWMEWMVHEVRVRYNTTDWTEATRRADDTRITLEIKPVSRKVGNATLTGFSYQYKYDSKSIPIYKILDRGTWEVGGKAVGNEIWQRCCFVPSIVAIKSIEQRHSTEWYLPGIENPNIFQFLPLQTELQGFTFTTAKEGTLITWPTKVAHVRTLIEKSKGKDDIAHWHEHCGDLGNTFETSPVEVLFVPGNLDKVGRANLHEAFKDVVHETLHNELGMRRERIATYGQIEEWCLPDMDRYTTLGLPKLLDLDLKIIYLANHFENNMNTYGSMNMCCTVDYKFAESVGEDKIRDFCRIANERGAYVEMWGNTSISALTVIFNFQEWGSYYERVKKLPKKGSIMELIDSDKNMFCRNPSNAIEADHYTPIFCVLNLRDEGVRDYWLKQWGAASKAPGLGGIFLDSSFNLSSDKFHYIQNAESARGGGATSDQTHLLGFYRPDVEPKSAILSQFKAHLELMRDMQKIGYVYDNEDIGVFGIHRHGPGLETRLDNLFLWSECICGFDVPAIEKAGAKPDEIYFRGLAYRMMWAIHWDVQKDLLSFNYGGVRGDYDQPNAWHKSLLKAYNECNELMTNREILPNEVGVVYNTGGKQVLWAFADLELPLREPKIVTDVLAKAKSQRAVVQAKKHNVYVIG